MLVAPQWVPARAASAATPRTVKIAVVDNNTMGAIRSYQTFMAAVERRFAPSGIKFEPIFIQLPTDDLSDQIPMLAKTLLPFNPDIIFASNDAIARWSAALNTGKPIIFYSNLDPLTFGLSDSLTRPNKGMTGFVLGKAVRMKRREMLLRLSPGCRVMGLLAPKNDDIEGRLNVALDAQEVFPGVKEKRFACDTVPDLDALLRSREAQSVDAWDVEYTQLPYRYAEETVQLFNRARKPVIFPRMKHVEMGGMAAYVPKIEESDDVWVSQMASLLAGVPISDIPIVQATRYSFGLNLKACYRAGVTPSKALIKIADVVIE